MIRSLQLTNSAQVLTAIFAELDRIDTFVKQKIIQLESDLSPQDAITTIRELVMFIEWNTAAVGKLLKKGRRRLARFHPPESE